MNYRNLVTESQLQKTVEALTSKGYNVIVVNTKAEALEKIKQLIPNGASLMNGSSRSLEEIGFIEYLKSENHQWNNLHAAIVAETDPAKQGQLRKQAVLSDYYLGSVHALLENGEFLVASNTGSQLPHIVFTSPNLIFVVGTQKIVSDMNNAMKRFDECVLPLENENMTQKYGMGTTLNKLVIFKGESPMMGRKVNLILVKEVLGF